MARATKVLSDIPSGALTDDITSGAGSEHFYGQNGGQNVFERKLKTGNSWLRIKRSKNIKWKKSNWCPRKKFGGTFVNTAEAVRRFKKGGKSLPNKATGHYNSYCYWQLTRCRHANIGRRLAIFGARHIFPPFRVYAAFQFGFVEAKEKWRVPATMKKRIARSDSKFSAVILTWTKRLVKKLGLRTRR